jgi:limonene-1,2-epoxide hydrolase
MRLAHNALFVECKFDACEKGIVMVTNVATEPQMVSPEEQSANAKLVVAYFDRSNMASGPQRWRDFFTNEARIYFPTRDDYQIPETFGPASEIFGVVTDAQARLGFTYDIETHSVYTCGPVVVLHRTDIRMQQGKPDKPVPAVGVFVVKKGKIVAWSDYYR